MNFNAVGLFCDDIRDEARGVNSVMGIWPDYVKLQPAPPGETAAIRMGIYVRTSVAVGEPPEDIRISLIAGDETISQIEIEASFVASTQKEAIGGGMPNAGFINKVLVPNFPVTKPTMLRLVVSSGDREVIAGAVSVTPNASPPPS